MLEQLLAENEGKTIEFKETTRSLNGIMKNVRILVLAEDQST